MNGLRRLVGAAMLNAATYEEIEADSTATFQAATVVALSSVAAGVGVTGMYDTAETLRFSAMTSVMALALWVSWALVTLYIGVRILPARRTEADIGQLLRTLGFSAAPGLIQVFAALPGMVIPVLALSFGWMAAASVVAVRQALDYTSTTRALAVAALGMLLVITCAAALGIIFARAVS